MRRNALEIVAFNEICLWPQYSCTVSTDYTDVKRRIARQSMILHPSSKINRLLGSGTFHFRLSRGYWVLRMKSDDELSSKTPLWSLNTIAWRWNNLVFVKCDWSWSRSFFCTASFNVNLRIHIPLTVQFSHKSFGQSFIKHVRPEKSNLFTQPRDVSATRWLSMVRDAVSLVESSSRSIITSINS